MTETRILSNCAVAISNVACVTYNGLQDMWTCSPAMLQKHLTADLYLEL